MPEFLFNEDAFDFFSKKIPEESCIFNLHNLFLNTPVLANCEKNVGNSELENDYNRIIADYKMLEQNVSDYKKAQVIFLVCLPTSIIQAATELLPKEPRMLFCLMS